MKEIGMQQSIERSRLTTMHCTRKRTKMPVVTPGFSNRPHFDMPLLMISVNKENDWKKRGWSSRWGMSPATRTTPMQQWKSIAHGQAIPSRGPWRSLQTSRRSWSAHLCPISSKLDPHGAACFQKQTKKISTRLLRGSLWRMQSQMPSTPSSWIACYRMH